MIMGLAPMDGITNLPYRSIVQQVCKQFGKPNEELWCWTEFMNADGYMIQPAKLVKHLHLHNREDKLIAQIYGGNMDTLAQTAIDIQEKYPQFCGIELNIGCPSPRVMACGGGSGMMRDKAYCLEVIKSISTAIDMPFSIKVRAGLTPDDKQAWFATLCDAAAHVHCVSIHGRVFKQGHGGFVDRDFIHRFKKAVGDQCLVIGNGGINSYDDAYAHMVDDDLGTKIDGIMIAQAAIANPWVFVSHEPSLVERHELCLAHLALCAAYELWGKHMIASNPALVDETSGQLVLNRKRLHALKKYDADSDERYELPVLDRHDYVFPVAKWEEMDMLAQEALNLLAGGPETALVSSDSLAGLYCPVEFRKYLFNYVKGLPGSKEFKQSVAQTRDFVTLWGLTRDYWEGLC